MTPPSSLAAQADLLPILVGITGKRRFDADPARHQHLAARFLARFDAVLAELDTSLPDTSKVLLCGAAAGVDLIAARAVLAEEGGVPRHPAWSVALVLPLAPDLFAEDFTDPGDQDDLAFLRTLLAGHPRVAVKHLRPLHCGLFDDRDPADPALPRLAPAELSRTGGDPAARRMHYEQLALWLARASTLLVAAAGAETADLAAGARPGGTARAVAFRRTGLPDDYAAQVIGRSDELQGGSIFDEPDGRHVLWIDPAADADRPVVLRPMRQALGERALKHPLRARDAILAAPMHDPSSAGTHGAPDNPEARLSAALLLPRAFQSWHARRAARPGAAAGAALPGDEHPVEFLEAVREGTRDAHGARITSELARQQNRAAADYRRLLRACAALFVTGIACFETYVEFHPTSLVLLAYVASLGLIWALTARTRASFLPQRAEDYRGLREMMRVQIAWWSAGIDRPVDQVHLRIIDTDLRLLRGAASAICTWAVLRCTRLPTCATGAITSAGAPAFRGRVQSWIDGQASYFARSARAQRGAVELAETVFRVALTAAIATLTVVGVGGLLVDKEAAGHWLASLHERRVAERLFPLVASAFVAGVLWLTAGRMLPAPAGRAASRRLPTRLASIALWLIMLGLWVAGFFLAGLNGRSAAQLLAELRHPVSVADLPAWLGPATVTVALGIAALRLLPTEAGRLRVQELSSGGHVLAVLLVLALVAHGALVAGPWVAHGSADLAATIGKLLTLESVLLLATAGMVRWYTERRNHVAQMAHYADMARVFHRAADWLASVPGPFDQAARRHLVELGELALDEGEAWLKAHRERPPEPLG